MTRRANPPKQRKLLSAQSETITASVRALPWETDRPNVAPAVLGDRIPGHRRGDHVKPRCELDPSGLFFCITCRQLLHNVTQLDMHTEQPGQGAHVVCRVCDAHGAELLV